MGTQQILMIILSVIVVGASVAVGIQMFSTQSDNQNLIAIKTELLQYAVQAQAWYRTPQMMGGGGRYTSYADYTAATGKSADVEIMRYINRDASGFTIVNDFGEFRCQLGGNPNATTIHINSFPLAFQNSDGSWSLTPVVFVDLAGGANRIKVLDNYLGGDSVAAW